jgi:hypothetical protein
MPVAHHALTCHRTVCELLSHLRVACAVTAFLLYPGTFSCRVLSPHLCVALAPRSALLDLGLCGSCRKLLFLAPSAAMCFTAYVLCPGTFSCHRRSALLLTLAFADVGGSSFLSAASKWVPQRLRRVHAPLWAGALGTLVERLPQRACVV